MPELHTFSPDKTGPLTIDCDCCELQGTSACDDCVVTFLLGREPDDAVVIDSTGKSADDVLREVLACL